MNFSLTTIDLPCTKPIFQAWKNFLKNTKSGKPQKVTHLHTAWHSHFFAHGSNAFPIIVNKQGRIKDFSGGGAAD